jgi:O-acetylserine/cysteine efflux transporter
LTVAVARRVHKRWSWTGLLLSLVAAALWGLAPVATKAALQGFTPEFVGCFRLAVAAVFFRALAGRGGRWFVANGWTWLAGVALGADFIFYNYGVQRTAANVAGLVINVELVSTIGFAVWLLGEQLSGRRVLGCAVTVAGVLVVTLDPGALARAAGGGRLVGDVLVMSAGVAWSLFAVAQRRGADGANLFRRLAPIFSVATLTTLPLLLQRGAWTFAPAPLSVAMLAILVVFGTALVYWVYARAQELIDVSVLAILLCSIPVFAVLFAYAVLGEPLTARLAVGGAIVVGGILVIAGEKGPAPEAAEVLVPRGVRPRRRVASAPPVNQLDSLSES